MDKNVNEKIFKNPASGFSKFCFEWLEPFVQALVVVMFIFCFIFRISVIDGKSMMNTLFDKEKVFVQKYNYIS